MATAVANIKSPCSIGGVNSIDFPAMDPKQGLDAMLAPWSGPSDSAASIGTGLVCMAMAFAAATV
ncbi:hypothetical protein ACHHYP_20771 [Achlya hypogyna]|uniref:Uncharacterized protein n=1 Tax=Achlya hypogyna TaxID=1202772 RepID=A0A1V9YAT6_ACHHY|nr:hypothetical protein ACHHYP_20771 [Achlya hypogyna]